MQAQADNLRAVWRGLSKWFGFALGVAALIGCNRSGLDLVPVEGVVTYNGAPVSGAGVMFVRAEGGLPGMAVTNAEGKFELKTANHPGALVGQYNVSISKSQTIAIPQQHGYPLYETK